MDRFRNGQRIRVIEPTHPMLDMTGTVVRLRRCDYQAWVDMDADLPMDLRSFPADDTRRNHTLLWPDECTEEQKAGGIEAADFDPKFPLTERERDLVLRTCDTFINSPERSRMELRQAIVEDLSRRFEVKAEGR